jgi:hypothetical protein
MLRIVSKTCLAGLIIVLFSLSGCSKKDEIPQKVSPLADPSGLLRYVPADTPYVLAALEPVPDELMDDLEPRVDRLLTSYRTLLRMTVDRSFVTGDGEPVDEAHREHAVAVVDEVTRLLSVEALRKIGIARDSAFVFYGHGLLPVFRITLSDSAPFEAEIARIEKAAGQALPVQTIGDIEYRYFDAEQAKVILALLDGQFVVTVAPSEFDDSQLAELLGISLPTANLAESGLLQDVADEYGFLATQLGMISNERLAETFLDEQTGTNSALLAVAGYDATTVTEVCREEYRSLAAVMPRIVFGARSISTERAESSVVVELRPDIASGLMSIPAAVPGLGTTRSGLISFGMSFNLLEARKFVEARLEALEASPYECEQLADFNAGAASARQALNQPVPPIAYNFRGFLALINDMQGFNPATKAPPESIDGSVLVGVEDPTQLLAFGQMMSPELAAMNLESDGQAQRVVLQQPASGIEGAWIAMSDNALAVSVDPDAETVLPRMLRADSAVPPPFLSVGVDVARYYGMFGMSLSRGGSQADAEMQAAIADVQEAAGDFYDRVAIDVRFTKKGIEMAGDATLSD